MENPEECLKSSPPESLEDAVWKALTSSHEALAVRCGQARRYPADVAPFAAIERQSRSAMLDLRRLLMPGESVYLLDPAPPPCAGLRRDGIVPCLQMLFPETAPLPPVQPGIEVVALDCDCAAEMMDLIAVSYPGYFRVQTCRMGHYYGVRDTAGTLIAMGGERLVFDPCREISGLCTHPEHAGKGLGTAVLHRVLAEQRTSGAISWLYVTQGNAKAIKLYERLGFQVLRSVNLHRITRVEVE